MTVQPTWPRQLRLPGQAAAPEGPVDPFMMYVLHHAFRRDVSAFAAAAPRTEVGDTVTWRALGERWDIFSRALHHHHHVEDRWLWPALEERVDEAGRTTLAAMEAEHSEIDPILESCAAGLAAMACGADEDTRAALAVRLAAARESLGRHLEHEERDAMALLQRVLTQAEWTQLERKFGEGVGFGEVLHLVRWVMHGLPPSAEDRILTDAGLVHRIIWRLTRGGFERLDRQAFRSLPTQHTV